MVSCQSHTGLLGITVATEGLLHLKKKKNPKFKFKFQTHHPKQTLLPLNPAGATICTYRIYTLVHLREGSWRVEVA